jgi:hypothetical protein
MGGSEGRCSGDLKTALFFPFSTRNVSDESGGDRPCLDNRRIGKYN